MNKKLERLLSKSWVFNISRNLPVWHSSTYMIWGEAGFRKYRVHTCLHFRIHRGETVDFYFLKEGKYSIDNLKNKLLKNFRDPDYIKFVDSEFKKDCVGLINLGRSVRKNVTSLHNFFELYGKFNSMLDVTSLGGKLITNKLLEMLEKYQNKGDILAYYGTPTKLAPVQKLGKEVEELRNKAVDIEKEAQRLHNKYCWIPVSFCGEPWGVDYFVKLIKSKSKQIKTTIVRPKERISKEIKYYLLLLREITYLNEFRKAAFSQACLLARPLLDQIAREHQLGDWKDINFLAHEEILDLLRGKDKYQKRLIAKRRILCAIYQEKLGEVKFLYGKDVLEFEKKFKPKADGVIELKGTIANKGLAKGKAKIISGPVDFYKFKKGNILIAKMTSVDFIPIMKKAAAFVTDEGGLACHAAVIAREYGVPCIIGTGFATVIFKDGDLVEVDAEKGIVKKI